MNHPIKQPAPLEILPWTARKTLELASKGIGKVCRDDVRGATRLSIDEIMAMTGLLIGFGLIATLPGEEPRETLIMNLKKETGQ